MRNMIKQSAKGILGMFLMLSVFTACDSDDPEPVNEEELITTVELTFTNDNDASDVRTASFTDLDGEGGNDPIIDNISLMADATYTLTVKFLQNHSHCQSACASANSSGILLGLQNQKFGKFGRL